MIVYAILPNALLSVLWCSCTCC